MKKLGLGIVIIFASMQLMAQSEDDYIEVARSVMKTEKKAAIADAMQLSAAEADVFWPLYNEFNEKLYAAQSKRIKIIKDFSENFESINDAKADEIWTAYMGFKQDILKLNKQYYKKFKKIMPAGKVAKYFQAENKIATMVDFKLSTEIPFIEAK